MDFISRLFASVTVSSGQPYEILLPIGLILVSAKLFSIVLGRFHVPSVIGFLIAGLVIGLVTFIPGQTILTSYTRSGIDIIAKFGVVLILFSAGIETDLKQVKSVGMASLVITGLGVIVPMALGFLSAFLFRVYGGMQGSFEAEGINPIYSDLYYGVILSATSVSITVAALKEMGKLETKVGSAVVSAAIIDDIIGIILLSLVISLSGSSASGSDFNLLGYILSLFGVMVSGGLGVLVIVLNMAIFFLLSWGISYLVKIVFNWLGNKFPHHIRIPIFSLAFCFIWAYVAQAFFQIADITGAYIAGLLLSATNAKSYIDHRTETTMNVFFAPVFFASVALKMYDGAFDFSNGSLFVFFGLTWVIAGMLGKVVGAGAGGLICHFSLRDSTKIGVGMMARAEVLIVTAQTGISAGLVAGGIMPFTLFLILITSFLTPILLRLLYKDELNGSIPPGGGEVEAKDPVVASGEPAPKTLDFSEAQNH